MLVPGVPGGIQLTVGLRWQGEGSRGAVACKDYTLALFDNPASNPLHYVNSPQNCQSGSYPVETLQYLTPTGTTRDYYIDIYYNGSGNDHSQIEFEVQVLRAQNRIESGFSVPYRSLEYPADNKSFGFMSVGATERGNARLLTGYSGRGPTTDSYVKPDLVTQTDAPTSFGILTGTSAATPHVAGIAALIKEAYPNRAAPGIYDFLRSRALEIYGQGRDNDTGYGRASLGLTPLIDIGVVAYNYPQYFSYGDLHHFTATIQNVGEATATGIVIQLHLPNELEFALNQSSPIVCFNNPGNVHVITCNVESMRSGETAFIDVLVRAVGDGTVNSVVSVTSRQADYNFGNNQRSGYSQTGPGRILAWHLRLLHRAD